MSTRTLRSSGGQDPDELPKYWTQLNQEIARIEARYPFIVTTLVTLLVACLAARDTSWFQSLQVLAPFAPYFVPVLVLLVLSYILASFRRVAVLRGYSAFVEDEINARHSNKVYLWNSRMITRFEQNNAPNSLMNGLNLSLAIICIWGTVVVVRQEGLGWWFLRPLNAGFCMVMLLLASIIAATFAKNDQIRNRSYLYALYQNYPEREPQICLYPGSKSVFDKSGIGRARLNQRAVLIEQGIRVTSDLSDPYRILHVNTWDLGAFQQIRRARRSGRAVVVSSHSTKEDFAESIPFSGLLKTPFSYWLRALYRRADLVLAPSEYAKKLVVGMGVATRVTVVSGGVDMAEFNVRKTERSQAFAHTRARKQISDQDKVVVGIGFTFRRKGIIDFISLARLFPDFKFVWCGPILRVWAGPAVCWQLLRKPKNVILLGFVSPAARLAGILNCADAFVGLSHEETEGLAVLEALACGTPSVLRDLPSYPPRRTTHRCVGVVDRSAPVAQIADVLQTVMENPATDEERREISKEAESRSADAIGKALLSAYRMLDPRLAQIPEPTISSVSAEPTSSRQGE